MLSNFVYEKYVAVDECCLWGTLCSNVCKRTAVLSAVSFCGLPFTIGLQSVVVHPAWALLCQPPEPPSLPGLCGLPHSHTHTHAYFHTLYLPAPPYRDLAGTVFASGPLDLVSLFGDEVLPTSQTAQC